MQTQSLIQPFKQSKIGNLKSLLTLCSLGYSVVESSTFECDGGNVQLSFSDFGFLNHFVYLNVRVFVEELGFWWRDPDPNIDGQCCGMASSFQQGHNCLWWTWLEIQNRVWFPWPETGSDLLSITQIVMQQQSIQTQAFLQLPQRSFQNVPKSSETHVVF